MIKKVTLLSFLVIAAFMYADMRLNTAFTSHNGPDPGHTGSPGDGKNCTVCHVTLAPDTQASIFSQNMPMTGFMGDSIYTITAGVSHLSSSKFGFQVSPQTLAGNLVGTLIVTDSVRTKLTASGKYISHTFAGTQTPFPGGSNWQFGWKAPNVAAPVTFYGAFNATNNNSQPTGDTIYVTSKVFTPDPSVGIVKPEDIFNTHFYPNPVQDQLFYTLEGNVGSQVLAEIYDIRGAVVATETLSSQTGSINVNELPSGIYFVKANNGSKTSVSKLLKL